MVTYTVIIPFSPKSKLILIPSNIINIIIVTFRLVTLFLHKLGLKDKKIQKKKYCNKNEYRLKLKWSRLRRIKMEKFEIEKIKEILNFNKRSHKEETLEEQMKKISELYPNCFENKEFAQFIGQNIRETEGLHIGHVYNFFDKSVQDELLIYCDYYDIHTILPDSLEILKDNIINGLSDEDYEKLELSNDSWVDYQAATMPREENGNKNVEGFRITIMENEYDEDGLNPQAYNSPVGIFVPLDNFKDARIDFWNQNDKDKDFAKVWVNKLSPMIESIKTLPYGNVKELLDTVEMVKEELSQQGHKHDISEIEETVSDRKTEDLNKIVSELSEERQDRLKDNEQTIDG